MLKRQEEKRKRHREKKKTRKRSKGREKKPFREGRGEAEGEGRRAKRWTGKSGRRCNGDRICNSDVDPNGLTTAQDDGGLVRYLRRPMSSCCPPWPEEAAWLEKSNGFSKWHTLAQFFAGAFSYMERATKYSRGKSFG